MSQTTTVSGVTYDCWDGSSARVISCDTTLTHVKVESSVTINGYVYPVTAIGNAAFGASRWDWSNANRHLQSVELPSGIHTIEECAFNRCIVLETIELPNTLTTIGEYAFSETNILSMELPASVVSIGYSAFSSSTGKLTCNSTTPPTLLSSSDGYAPTLGNISIVYVPTGSYSAYKSVDPWASKVVMDGVGVSANITVTPGMLGEEVLNQVSYLSDVNYLTISGAINDTDINNIKNSMPNLLTIDMSGLEMKSIPEGMFSERKALLSIILPKKLETIGDRAFYGCINLESIVLPEGLKSINGYSSDWDSYEHGAFRGCTSLKSVLFPSTLETIGGCTFGGCTALKEVMFKSGLKTIGHDAFSGCNRLYKIDFSEGLANIGDRAFNSCRSLVNLNFPKSLTDISRGAFANCSSLESVTFAEGIKSIGYEYEGDNTSSSEGAFQNCSALKQIVFAKGLEKICQNTFSGCSSLSEVVIPEGVIFIGRNAFNRCSKLTSVSLPSSLISCGTTPFSGCNKLSSVKCEALLPPTLADGLLTLDDMGLALKRTLSVPEWTLNRYKLTSGWAAFAEILPLSGIYPSSINVIGEAVLTLPAAGLPANYKPDMQIIPSYSFNGMMMAAYGSPSSLHLRGTGTLPLSTFTINAGYDASNTKLLTEATITADKVIAEMYLSGTYYDNISYMSKQKWHFLSFPFDVKISEITTNSDWVVRKYDGKARANCDYNNTWVTVPYDSILHAGQGYIWACTDGSFTLPAVDNVNKNLIFANTTRNVPLQEYTSEYISNSSWNLVGNPFPCYYNTNEMDYAAPITVWDSQNNTYAAYSPVDDSYVLRPFEAFFVQCPSGVKNIGFKPEGRQLDGASLPSMPKMSPLRTHEVGSLRQVFNLVLNNEQGADRTRIVLNDEAKMDYELSCDAAKFLSNDVAMAQLYSVCGEEQFAINERPLGDGVIKLGTRFAIAGTYTITMESTADMTVMLIDLKTGVETNLTAENYTFYAEDTDSDRFEVRMYADETTTINDVAADAKVAAVGYRIEVTAPSVADVELYNAAGSLIATGHGTSVAFDVAQGLYLVKVNGVSHKIAVAK